MPSLVRFLIIAVMIGAVVLAGMLALATLVHVTPRPMEQAIPAGKLK